MEEHPMGQSARNRACEDTKKLFHSSKFFWVVEVGLMTGFGFLGEYLIPEGASKIVSAAYPAIGAIVGALVGFGIIYLTMFFTAPYKQRNEARAKVTALEKERELYIEVHPIAGQRASYEHVRYSAWAELEVKNTRSDMALENVKVRIVELLQVYKKQDEGDVYSLHAPHPNWAPSNVYWSERNAEPKQFSLSISPNDSSCALIAFHADSMPAYGVFNTPTYIPMLESKIVVEVSSNNSRILRRAYYIEYHPPGRDEFEFMEWDLWCKSHNVDE